MSAHARPNCDRIINDPRVDRRQLLQLLANVVVPLGAAQAPARAADVVDNALIDELEVRACRCMGHTLPWL